MLAIFCNAQPGNSNQDNLTVRQQRIIKALYELNGPNNPPFSKFKRSEIVTALKIAQRDSYGRKTRDYAYWLALLGENYAVNKTRLLTAMHTCNKYKPGDLDFACDEQLVEYLYRLYLKGDKSLVKPLFVLANGSDGAMSESLGSVYAEMIEKNTSLFLQALSKFLLTKQKHIIELTIRQDGSCTPKCLPVKVRKHLRQISLDRASPLQKIARLVVYEMNSPDLEKH